MNDETKIKLQFQNNVSGDKKLENYAKQLERIYGLVSALDKGQGLKKIDTNVKNININVKQTSENSKKLGTTFSNIFNIAKITAFTKAFQNLFAKLSSASKKSSEYIENVNLLEVAYKNANESIEDSSRRIEDFIDKMSDVYGLDESRLTRQFGIFKQLANAMQLPAEQGERLSEIMVKMTNDVASLYNLDLARASNALQSALVGQTRPIRGATGADITEKTLQTTADALGLDRQISELSFVEKRLVMVISLTNQLKVSQGDYARTIESAANQMKILDEQWSRLTRTVGNVFYPLLQGILPYINGVLMALTEIFDLIATMLGFEMPEFDYSSLSTTSDAALDLMEELDGASDSVDKLDSKLKGLRTFDKLNVISSQKKGETGAGGTFVDPKIMGAFNKAFEEYNDLMDSVKMKAKDIRDSIMEWLGFTKKINPLTGDISWEYEGIEKTLSNMWNSFTKLNPLVKVFVGYGIAKIFKNLVEFGGKLTGIIGEKGLVKDFSKVNEVFGKVKTVLLGAGGLIVGFNLITDAFSNANKEGEEFTNTLKAMGGYLSNVAGGAMIGSVAGPLGSVIGAAAGSVFSLITGMMTESKNYVDFFIEDTTKELDDFTNELNSQFKSIQETASQDLTKITITEKLIDELERITEANGKVKQGYEDRAKFIINDLNKAYGTEIQMVDGVIQKYDEQIKSIKDIIEQRKGQIYLNLAEEQYTTAIKNQAKAEQELKQIDLERQLILQDSTKSEKEKKKALQEIDKQEKKAYNNLLLIQKAKTNYSNLSTAILNGNTQQIKENTDAIDQYFKDLDKATTESNYDMYKTSYNTWREIGLDIGYNFKSIVEASGKSYDEMTKAEKDATSAMLNDFVENTSKYLDEVGTLGLGMGIQWQAIGETSTEAFLVAFEKIPANLRQMAINEIYPEGIGMSEELQKGINEKFPEIKINPKLQQPSSTDLYNYGKTLSDNITATITGKSILGSIDIKNILSNYGKKEDGGVFTSGEWQPIQRYDGGGTPQTGQLFWARENGLPEMVGQLGGHTAVMNNDQIVSSVASGVYQAVKSATSSTNKPEIINIYLDKNTKLATYMLDKLDNMAKSNGKAIEIGG